MNRPSKQDASSEAAIIGGAGPLRVFFLVILPLLRRAAITVVVQSLATFNDFTNPLYYLPGKQDVPVQLTPTISRASSARRTTCFS